MGANSRESVRRALGRKSSKNKKSAGALPRPADGSHSQTAYGGLLDEARVKLKEMGFRVSCDVRHPPVPIWSVFDEKGRLRAMYSPHYRLAALPGRPKIPCRTWRDLASLLVHSK